MSEFLRDLFVQLLGPYNPPTYEMLVDGEYIDCIPSGMAGVDWTWVMSAVMLIVVVYCVMRFIGVLLKNA